MGSEVIPAFFDRSVDLVMRFRGPFRREPLSDGGLGMEELAATSRASTMATRKNTKLKSKNMMRGTLVRGRVKDFGLGCAGV